MRRELDKKPHSGNAVSQDLAVSQSDTIRADVVADCPSEMSDYQQEWQRYKRLKAYFFILWLAPFFFFTAVTKAVKIPALSAMIFILYAIIFLFAGFRFKAFRCPQCGNTFCDSWKFPFADKCIHCGLRKFSTPH
jgi:hypothetical protein